MRFVGGEGTGCCALNGAPRALLFPAPLHSAALATACTRGTRTRSADSIGEVHRQGSWWVAGGRWLLPVSPKPVRKAPPKIHPRAAFQGSVKGATPSRWRPGDTFCRFPKSSFCLRPCPSRPALSLIGRLAPQAPMPIPLCPESSREKRLVPCF